MEFSHPLKSAFIPHAVAVVGASDREGSRGTYVWNGVMNGRRALEAYPVNPKYKYIGVTPCWASLSELPAKIDLAVITPPASTVMGLLKECKKLGIGNVLLCPGDDAFTRDRHWRREVAQFAAASGLRLIGPFSMGIMRPSIGLNVSYWPQLAESGSIALISQSGAVTASILDFAARSAELDLRAGELPPTFYCYGTEDPFYRQFLANADAVEEAGVPVERLQLDGMPHGFGTQGGWLPAYDQWLAEIFAGN